MRLLKTLERIKRIDALIQRKATGTPKELAEKLGISESSLYNNISLMKSMGAAIYYCPFKMSYCYQEHQQFVFGFVQKD